MLSFENVGILFSQDLKDLKHVDNAYYDLSIEMELKPHNYMLKYVLM